MAVRGGEDQRPHRDEADAGAHAEEYVEGLPDARRPLGLHRGGRLRRVEEASQQAERTSSGSLRGARLGGLRAARALGLLHRTRRAAQLQGAHMFLSYILRIIIHSFLMPKGAKMRTWNGHFMEAGENWKLPLKFLKRMRKIYKSSGEKKFRELEQKLK